MSWNDFLSHWTAIHVGIIARPSEWSCHRVQSEWFGISAASESSLRSPQFQLVCRGHDKKDFYDNTSRFVHVMLTQRKPTRGEDAPMGCRVRHCSSMNFITCITPFIRSQENCTNTDTQYSKIAGTGEMCPRISQASTLFQRQNCRALACSISILAFEFQFESQTMSCYYRTVSNAGWSAESIFHDCVHAERFGCTD